MGQTHSKNRGSGGDVYPLEFPAADYQNVQLADSSAALGPCSVGAPDQASCLQMYNDADEAYMADVYIGTPP
jgi:hypothetical protein